MKNAKTNQKVTYTNETQGYTRHPGTGRLVEERSGRGKVSGPLHDFPLKRGESVTIFRRKGVRLCWRWDK